MDVTPIVADGARWGLAALFALACVEKASSLLRRTAAWHPVMLVSPRRRRRAQLLMGASLLADAAAVFLLLAAPILGALIASALIVLCTWAAKPLHERDEPTDCKCFFRVLNTRTRSGLVGRNCLLLVMAIDVLLGRPTGSWVGAMLGGALLGGTQLSAALADRISEIRRRQRLARSTASQQAGRGWEEPARTDALTGTAVSSKDGR